MRIIYTVLTILALMAAPQTARAFEYPEKDERSYFVSSTMLFYFYHELGHAMIYVLNLPLLGREEDAADSLASLLTHQLWEEDDAAALMDDVTYSFQLYSDEAEAYDWEMPFWDEHSLDMVRYFQTLCMFYGGNPEQREYVIDDYGLPEERADWCPSDFQIMQDSWNGLLESAAYREGGKGLVMVGDQDHPLARLIADEVANLNTLYSLPEEVSVEVAECGEPNAFFNSEAMMITMCTEFIDDLERLYDNPPLP